MEVGFETIGNATLICHDRAPVLVTDPWIVGSAYFGSWKLSHEIPQEQMAAIQSCEYVWLSHGHPDHMSGESLDMLKGKKILLPNHVGNRIAVGMQNAGFNVSTLQDRAWTVLSPRIRILCIADYNQDAVLLLDINGTLVVNVNDASNRGWFYFVKRVISQFKDTFLLRLFGYGDSDHINFVDEFGVRIAPKAAKKLPVGHSITAAAEAYGVKHVIPFSSMHRYQRGDSVWANQYSTPLEAYRVGFTARGCELLPAFIRYDCLKKSFKEIKPKENLDFVMDPNIFGDDWSEPLDRYDSRRLDAYFRSISHLERNFDFLNFRVGGKDNRIEFSKRNLQKGITFEAPRNSLMQAIEFEIFDDILIGNFVKTRLEGKWPATTLHPDFTPYVAKYADNGRAKSADELRIYFREYRKRAPLDYLRHRIPYRLAQMVRPYFKSNTMPYQFAHSTWRMVQRWT
jgi:hypothetical protein